MEPLLVLSVLSLAMLLGCYIAGSIPLVMTMSEVCLLSMWKTCTYCHTHEKILNKSSRGKYTKNIHYIVAILHYVNFMLCCILFL